MNSENPTTVAKRRYLRDFLIVNVIYVLVLFATVTIVRHAGIEGALRYVLMLVPLVPVVLMLPILIRYLRETDEFERRLQTESLAIAAGVTALFSVTYGFLEVAGAPHLSAWWTWSIVMFSWGVARCFVGRRYE